MVKGNKGKNLETFEPGMADLQRLMEQGFQRLSSEVNSVKSEFKEIKTSLQQIGDKLGTLECRIQTTESTVETHQDIISQLLDKIEQQEMQVRKMNLVISGLAELENETEEQLRTTLMTLIL
jgi:chromosome segregation ATPase